MAWKVDPHLYKELQGLTKAELSLLDKFNSGNAPSLFTSVADILRKRGYIEESIVILEDGISQFPEHVSAHVALARDYFLKGMLPEARQLLTRILKRQQDNLMAQRLALKLDILFDDCQGAQTRLLLMKSLFPDDEFTRTLRRFVDSGEWQSARERVFADLSQRGIAPTAWEGLGVPGEKGHAGQLDPGAQKATETSTWRLPSAVQGQAARDESAAHKMAPDGARILPAEPQGMQQVFQSNPDLYKNLNGYRIVLRQEDSTFKDPLTQGIYAASVGEGAAGGGGWSEKGGSVSLDSLTLAEIYASQGLVYQAVDILEKLLKQSPDRWDVAEKLSVLKSKNRFQGASAHPKASEVQILPPTTPSPVTLSSQNASSQFPSHAHAHAEKIRLLQKILKRIDIKIDEKKRRVSKPTKEAENI